MIEFHADDYGLFPQQSQRILDCAVNGVLSGVSIMPNSEYLDTCMEMLSAAPREIALTVHLNLVEGHCLARPEEVPLLVDENGNFNISFVKLLLASFTPKRSLYRRQIRQELLLQIRRCQPYFGDKPLRLDCHVHYQEIPVVFDSIMDLIREEHLHVSFLRMPREKLHYYFPLKGFHGLKAINLVKVLVLNTLDIRNRTKYRSVLSHMEQRDFFGVACSGNMCYENASLLLKRYRSKGKGAKDGLEMLFHPGSVLEKECIAKLTSEDDLHFLTSEGRAAEADALKRIT